MAYDPTAFVTEKATKLVKLVRETDEEIAIEMLSLHLRLTYQDGYNKGLQDGFTKRPPVARSKA